MLFQRLRNWQPFKIDALGLVTLMGAEEMNIAVGCLMKSYFLEYFPLLAPHVVASNAIMSPKSGFVLYNVSDGVMATDVAGWFCRWLLNQRLTWNSTHLYFTQGNYHKPASHLPAIGGMILAGVVMSLCMVVAVLSSDWWACANVAAMIVSIFVRRFVLDACRAGIDQACQSTQGSKPQEQYCKFMVLTAGGAAVIAYAPRGIITDVLLTNPRPPHETLYHMVRILGWAGFGVHVITLGMASLANQIITVVILLASSILVAYKLGCDEWTIGSRLHISRLDDTAGEDRRSNAYLSMQLTASEEDSLLAWGLLPHRTNTVWWSGYETRKQKVQFRELWKWKHALEPKSSV